MLRHIPISDEPCSAIGTFIIIVTSYGTFTRIHRKGRNVDASKIGKRKKNIEWRRRGTFPVSTRSRVLNIIIIIMIPVHESWCCDGRTTGNNEIIKINTLLVWWMCFLLHHCAHGTTKEAQNGGINHNSNSKRSIFFSPSIRWRVCVCVTHVRADTVRCKWRKINFHLFVHEGWSLWLTRHEHK